MTKPKLYDLLDVRNPQEVFTEITHIVSLMTEGFDSDIFKSVFDDVERLFNGHYPGYQASKTKYHDHEHTLSVVLATARLMHGCHLNGTLLSPRNILLGLLASLFHDVGLIQTVDETKGTGAKFTVEHEERSIHFMKTYLSSKDFSSADTQTIAHCIEATILSLPVKDIQFRSGDTQTLGQIVGSADLLAQMADRNYLEKLLLLFQEFEEAGIPGFDSELELLQKTEDFYNFVARKRLSEDMEDISSSMQLHFQSRWNMDPDLYEASISKNIGYLKSLTAECEDSLQCYLDNLKRLVNKRR